MVVVSHSSPARTHISDEGHWTEGEDSPSEHKSRKRHRSPSSKKESKKKKKIKEKDDIMLQKL